MAKIKNPTVGIQGESEENTVAQEAAQILAFIPKHQKYAAS
jgi:hypothetical protein